MLREGYLSSSPALNWLDGLAAAWNNITICFLPEKTLHYRTYLLVRLQHTE